MEAPKVIPAELYNAYSMNGKISMGYNYRNDCSEEIQNEINAKFTKEEFRHTNMTPYFGSNVTQNTDLNNINIENKLENFTGVDDSEVCVMIFR